MKRRPGIRCAHPGLRYKWKPATSPLLHDQRAEQPSQALRCLVAIDSGCGDIPRERFPVVDGIAWQTRPRQASVSVQKNQARRERGALVAVDEWAVAREIEQVRCGDADCIRDQGLASVRRLRRRHGGLKERSIAYAGTTAVRGDHFGMYRRDSSGIEMDELARAAGSGHRFATARPNA